MSSIFCCSSIKAYRPARLDHEAKFDNFMRWTQADPGVPANGSSLVSDAKYAVQLVRQVNYGPQESIRYFIPVGNNAAFLEVSEDALLSANFQKLNSFKNFRCEEHNKFFELNLYQENPINKHHWRANLGRPARDIDLALREVKVEVEVMPAPSTEEKATTVSSSQERPSSDLGRELSPSDESHSAGVPDNQASEVEVEFEFEVHEKKSLAQLLVTCSTRISTLRPMLQFLLPGVGASLGSNSLLSLLSLDCVNRELDLGLNYEDLWESELTSDNISIFLNSCIELSGGESVSLADIEELVDRAMVYIDSLKSKQVLGRTRFENIINRVLESNASEAWISQHESKIRQILASGPSEELLLNSRQKDEEMLQHRTQRKDVETIATWFTKGHHPLDDDSENYENDHYYGSNWENEQMKDYTACDKECGYCGNCDY
ncbi:hypothetical protein GQX73_g9698 [Xylaria multiplex]|uniref:Uncharacterized protein n=1 Tax=Xylaria multiplex TaxID=323545 RepID=A0A7C8MML9_9PEZI|nr:hypothetical protein GQX73_g9698 [Xylaria multiplex]